MKTIHYYILLLFCFVSLPLLSQHNNQYVNRFATKKDLKHASIGICIRDLSSGKDIVSYNGNQSLTPASILKVITSATALEVLGKDYRYKTELSYQDDKTLIVRGYGDPTLGSEYLSKDQTAFLSDWATAVRENVKDSEFDLLIVDNYFGYEGVSQKWIREDIGNYFAAGVYGISVFDNTYSLFFNTSRIDTCPQILYTKPHIEGLLFQNTLKINTSGKDDGYIMGEPFSNSRLLIGDIPGGKKLFSIKGDIPNPGLLLGEVFGKTLNEKGFTVHTVTTARDKYYTEMFSHNRTKLNNTVFYTSYTSYSPPLSDIIRVVNERSNNHYTEHLIRTIGRANNADIYTNALNEGITFTSDYWKSKGIDSEALMMYDGCGLSPSNAVSPNFMCDVLSYMYNDSKNSNTFLQSLPKAGKEGTVRNFLKDTRLESKVFVKSGSIAKVQCFAGYYIHGGKKYAFCVMVNNFNSSHREVVKAIESLLLGVL